MIRCIKNSRTSVEHFPAKRRPWDAKKSLGPGTGVARAVPPAWGLGVNAAGWVLSSLGGLSAEPATKTKSAGSKERRRCPKKTPPQSTLTVSRCQPPAAAVAQCIELPCHSRHGCPTAAAGAQCIELPYHSMGARESGAQQQKTFFWGSPVVKMAMVALEWSRSGTTPFPVA